MGALPIYLGKRFARIRLGRRPPEIEVGWLAVEVLNDNSKDVQTTAVKLERFRPELFFMTSEDDVRKMPEIIELLDEK